MKGLRELPADAPELIREMNEIMWHAMHLMVPNDWVDALPDPLPVPVTEGAKGSWSISTFTLSPMQAFGANLGMMRKGGGRIFLTKPGTYTRLVHKDRGVVMSNTPMEVLTNMEFIEKAHGNVVINGLGLGMVLHAILKKTEVGFVRVYELDDDIIDLIAPAFALQIAAGRLAITKADAYTHKPKGEFYDVAWHDIWDDISDSNLPDMQRLADKWKDHAKLQLFWGRDHALKMQQAIEWVEKQREPQGEGL